MLNDNPFCPKYLILGIISFLFLYFLAHTETTGCLECTIFLSFFSISFIAAIFIVNGMIKEKKLENITTLNFFFKCIGSSLILNIIPFLYFLDAIKTATEPTCLGWIIFLSFSSISFIAAIFIVNGMIKEKKLENITTLNFFFKCIGSSLIGILYGLVFLILWSLIIK